MKRELFRMRVMEGTSKDYIIYDDGTVGGHGKESLLESVKRQTIENKIKTLKDTTEVYTLTTKLCELQDKLIKQKEKDITLLIEEILSGTLLESVRMQIAESKSKVLQK